MEGGLTTYNYDYRGFAPHVSAAGWHECRRGEAQSREQTVVADRVSSLTRLKNGEEIHFGKGNEVPLPDPRTCNEDDDKSQSIRWSFCTC